jgi:hypothetical protein
MKHQPRIESSSREATQTRALIADLNYILEIVEASIVAEEEQSGIADRLRPDYPAPARALIARRDNLMETISALRSRCQ